MCRQFPLISNCKVLKKIWVFIVLITYSIMNIIIISCSPEVDILHVACPISVDVYEVRFVMHESSKELEFHLYPTLILYNYLGNNCQSLMLSSFMERTQRTYGSNYTFTSFTLCKGQSNPYRLVH